MSYSAWMIRPPAGQQPQSAVQRRVSAPAGGDTASFAAVMEGSGEIRAAANMSARPQLLPGAGNPVLAGRSPSDLIRFQTLGKAQADLQQTKALEGMLQGMGSGSTLELARSMGAARQLRSGTALFEERRSFSLADMLSVRPSAKKQPSAQPADRGGVPVGQLSARFESGSEGIAAIGYDRNGGTSYGKYQIASRVGSMKQFLGFLDNEAPELAQRLREAGPANTGSRRGAMPNVWRAIASEQPERFEELQEAFIHESHYKPAVAAIAERTGLDPKQLSPAMREVIWSTAVQHGPAGAARLFDRANSLSGEQDDPAYERKLINNVYKLRAGQFGSSSTQVQAAVQNRFREERLLALNMLDAGKSTALA